MTADPSPMEKDSVMSVHKLRNPIPNIREYIWYEIARLYTRHTLVEHLSMMIGATPGQPVLVTEKCQEVPLIAKNLDTPLARCRTPFAESVRTKLKDLRYRERNVPKTPSAIYTRADKIYLFKETF